jgi:hypothetical protein
LVDLDGEHCVLSSALERVYKLLTRQESAVQMLCARERDVHVANITATIQDLR